MAGRLLAAAPACTAPVIMRTCLKWFQPKQDLGVQGAGGSLGLPMNRRAGRDLLLVTGEAAGDVLTVSMATGFVVGRELAGPLGTLSVPGTGIREVPFDSAVVPPRSSNETAFR